MVTEPEKSNEQVIKRSKDAALRCMNAIRYHKMGKPIMPVWPICPGCSRLCAASLEVYNVSRTGFCSECSQKAS